MPKKPTVGDKEMKESGSDEEEEESDNESGESQDDRIDKKAAMMSLTGGREEAANKSKQLTVEQFKQLCGNREKLYNHLSFSGKVTFICSLVPLTLGRLRLPQYNMITSEFMIQILKGEKKTYSISQV